MRDYRRPIRYFPFLSVYHAYLPFSAKKKKYLTDSPGSPRRTPFSPNPPL
jgi:hypothetical protein